MNKNRIKDFTTKKALLITASLITMLDQKVPSTCFAHLSRMVRSEELEEAFRERSIPF